MRRLGSAPTGSSTSAVPSVEVYRDPAGRGKAASYREAVTFEAGSEVPVVIDGHDLGRISVKRPPPLTGAARR